jgi:hypothetical protein
MERMWRLKVKESIEYFLQLYKFEKLTLSFNQWSTICKTKQINEAALLSRQAGGGNGSLGGGIDAGEEFDDASIIDASSILIADGATNGSSSSSNRIKYVGNNCAIISINETDTNVEMSIVGPNIEVDRFIVKIKDVICKAYFTFELEEKIIKFKTYLFECEELLNKWLKMDNIQIGLSGNISYGADLADSDAELTLATARSNDSDSLSIAYKTSNTNLKLNKSRRNTIDEFISKLERDHLDMELSYGKLFQELGYTFLNSNPANHENADEDDFEYKEFNDRQVYLNSLFY